ncbi:MULTISPECIES: hypothetical protein [Cupriavidus]
MPTTISAPRKRAAAPAAKSPQAPAAPATTARPRMRRDPEADANQGATKGEGARTNTSAKTGTKTRTGKGVNAGMPERAPAPAKPSLLTRAQLAQIKLQLGYADYIDFAEALGLSHVSVKRIMTAKQAVTEQLAFQLMAMLYFHDHPRAAAQFSDLLTEYKLSLPQVSK